MLRELLRRLLELLTAFDRECLKRDGEAKPIGEAVPGTEVVHHLLLVVHDERLGLAASGDLQVVLIPVFHLVAKRYEKLGVQADRIGAVGVALLQAPLQIPRLRLTVDQDVLAVLGVLVAVVDLGPVELRVKQVVPRFVHVCEEVGIIAARAVPLVNCLQGVALRLHEDVMPAGVCHVVRPSRSTEGSHSAPPSDKRYSHGTSGESG